MGLGSILKTITKPHRAIAGGLSDVLGGNVLEALPFVGQAVSAHTNREFSAQQASNQMAFQREMSSTAYSRAAKDLEKAGLNRILAIGGPSTTPAGAMGIGATPEDNTSSAVSAIELGKVKGPMARATIAEKQANTLGIQENIRTQQSQQALNSANAARAKTDTLKTIAETEGLKHDNKGRKIRNQAIEALGVEGQILGDAADIASKVGGAAGSILNVFNPLRGKLPNNLRKAMKDNYKVNKKTGEVKEWLH